MQSPPPVRDDLDHIQSFGSIDSESDDREVMIVPRESVCFFEMHVLLLLNWYH